SARTLLFRHSPWPQCLCPWCSVVPPAHCSSKRQGRSIVSAYMRMATAVVEELADLKHRTRGQSGQGERGHERPDPQGQALEFHPCFQEPSGGVAGDDEDQDEGDEGHDGDDVSQRDTSCFRWERADMRPTLRPTGQRRDRVLGEGSVSTHTNLATGNIPR